MDWMDWTNQVPGYHTKITRPVHMRLVDERLKRGGYLNEFAFVSLRPPPHLAKDGMVIFFLRSGSMNIHVDAQRKRSEICRVLLLQSGLVLDLEGGAGRLV